ncbi:HypC/HybG/HupF family hydrogenase formation chaperone [Candidatus Aenigmatarchaeota archaeon]
MCMASLGQIIEINGKAAKAMINKKEMVIAIDLVDVEKGDYVLCSGGIAIEKLTKEEAEKMITC